MIATIETGIKGLDEILNGGIPKGNSVIVEGDPGTGKTTLGVQYLYNGAKKGEPGIYITFEELPSQIYKNMENYGWHLRELDEQGLLKVLSISPTALWKEMRTPFGLFEEVIDEINCKRIVIDSISIFQQLEDNQSKKMRDIIYQFQNILRKYELTSFILRERSSTVQHQSAFENFIFDGVIHLAFQEKYPDYKERTLEVLKMRGTKIAEGKHTYRFTDEGIYILTAYLSELIPKIKQDNSSTIPTGLNKIDQLLGGGIRKGDIFLVETDSISKYNWLIESIVSNRIKHNEKFLYFLSYDSTIELLHREYHSFEVDLIEGAKNGNGLFIEMFDRDLPHDIRPMVLDVSKMGIDEYSRCLQYVDEYIETGIENGENWFCFLDMSAAIDKWGKEPVNKLFKDLVAIKRRQRLTTIILSNVKKLDQETLAIIEDSSDVIIETWHNQIYQYLQVKKTPSGMRSQPYILETIPTIPFYRLM